MDDYNDVCEKLKEDKVHDEELWQPYDLDYEEHQQYAENLIENRISSKKNRNSVPATSDLFKVFENSWSDWIPLMTPRAKEHFFMRPGQSGYRIGMKELKFHLEKFELKGGGIFEFGTAEWIVQVDDHKQTGEDEGVRDRSEPKKVVFIAYASEIGVAIDRYCRDGSHPAKSEVINRVLTKGDQAIMVRGRRSENPERDKDVVLKKYRYPWNEVYPDVLIYNKFPDFADSFIKPVIEVKSQHGFMTMRHRKQLPAKLDPEESVDESWIDAPSVGGQQGDSKTAHDSGKSKVPRDVDALAEKIKEYLARPISYAKLIGKGGGKVLVLGCMLKFPENAFDKDTKVSLTVRSPHNEQDGCRLISPMLQCSTSGVQFRNFATMRLPIYCRNLGGAAIIMCKKSSDGEWKEVKCQYEEDDGALIFQVQHLCTWGAWLRKMWPFTGSIIVENHLYFKWSTDAVEICGITCVGEEKHRQACLEVMKANDFESAMVLHDNVEMKKGEEMRYSLEVISPPYTHIRPQHEIAHTQESILSGKFIKILFYFRPTPPPNIKSAFVDYTLVAPNRPPQISGLVLRRQEARALNRQSAHNQPPPRSVIERPPKIPNPIGGDHSLTDAVPPHVHVIRSTQEDYHAHLRDKYMYRIDPHRQKGRVLIINNDFSGTREGSEVDVRNMKDLWEDLGFEVVATPNLTAQQMLDSCRLFAASAVVVIIMSHGGKADGKEYLAGEDDQKLFVEDIVNVFTANMSPHFAGIPKVFLFQACRGGAMERATEIDAQVEEKLNSQQMADMVMTFPTQPGYVAIRDPLEGSWLMNAVTNVFVKHAHDTHLMDMLTMVNGAVSRKIGPVGEIQISNQSSYFTKKLRLFPGWPNRPIDGQDRPQA